MIDGKYHFIGIGGIGMSGLAKLLLSNGAQVTGSDQENSSVIEKLIGDGATITIGHNAENIPETVDAVVISAAIKDSNPELAQATAQKAKILKYAEMLGELMDNYAGIAVCGTHGKSTTSGWLTYVMDQAGANPNYIVGAEIPQLSGSSDTGSGPHFIAEACEYDRSFLNLRPKIAVILNIEQDHLDYYADEAEIVDAFADFTTGVTDDGIIIANAYDPNVEEVRSRLKPSQKCLTFGIGEDCDFRADNIELIDGFYEFEVYQNADLLGKIRISLAGRHNILNALAVIATAISAGIDPKTVLEHLPRFMGIDRRNMLKAKIADITIVDDYAHHPTEIQASLAAIRQQYNPTKLWCIFQPHQYSRTRFLLDDFAESFKLADVTVMPEIYFVRDTAAARKQVNAEVLVTRIRQRGCQAFFIDDFASICDYLINNVKPGHLVVTMGAGDIWKVADEYIQWLRVNRQD